MLDNFSPHTGEKVRQWAADHNVELAYTTFYASWLNRIEAQFRALRYFTLAGTDHPDHATQARLIRRYIAWRNRNTDNPRLRALVEHGQRCLTLQASRAAAPRISCSDAVPGWADVLEGTARAVATGSTQRSSARRAR